MMMKTRVFLAAALLLLLPAACVEVPTGATRHGAAKPAYTNGVHTFGSGNRAGGGADSTTVAADRYGTTATSADSTAEDNGVHTLGSGN
jgi:ABC-type oligopeptide transport system substrate-binding subunit